MGVKNIKNSGHNILIKGNKCYRCCHEWISREMKKPAVCPKCKSPYWDKPKTKVFKKVNKNEK